jgi:hypothetical protein
MAAEMQLRAEVIRKKLKREPVPAAHPHHHDHQRGALSSYPLILSLSFFFALLKIILWKWNDGSRNATESRSNKEEDTKKRTGQGSNPPSPPRPAVLSSYSLAYSLPPLSLILSLPLPF